MMKLKFNCRHAAFSTPSSVDLRKTGGVLTVARDNSSEIDINDDAARAVYEAPALVRFTFMVENMMQSLPSETNGETSFDDGSSPNTDW